MQSQQKQSTPTSTSVVPQNKLQTNPQIKQHPQQTKQKKVVTVTNTKQQTQQNQNKKQEQIKQQPKKQVKQKQQQQQADIDNLINQFQQGNLNLTNEQDKQQAQDAEVMEQVKKQYQKFMKQMQNQDGDAGMGGFDGLGVGNLGKAFQELLSGMDGGDQTGKHIGEKFQSMFKNMENPDGFQKAAAELLNQFMDKSLLEQPLTQTKQNYQKYMKQRQLKNQTVAQNYKQQYKIVCQLVEVVKNQPQNKQQMIRLFSLLQEKGNPPQGIAPGLSLF